MMKKDDFMWILLNFSLIIGFIIGTLGYFKISYTIGTIGIIIGIFFIYKEKKGRRNNGI